MHVRAQDTRHKHCSQRPLVRASPTWQAQQRNVAIADRVLPSTYITAPWPASQPAYAQLVTRAAPAPLPPPLAGSPSRASHYASKNLAALVCPAILRRHASGRRAKARAWARALRVTLTCVCFLSEPWRVPLRLGRLRSRMLLISSRRRRGGKRAARPSVCNAKAWPDAEASGAP
jgi:hypothetical protein